MWVAGDWAIAGNEKADIEAKYATTKRSEAILIEYTDWYIGIKERIKKKWNDVWRQKQKRFQIKPTMGKWERPKRLKRRDEVIINRLRTGHTKLTHGHIMEGFTGNIPQCSFCTNNQLTIKHIFEECQSLTAKRRQCSAKYQSKLLTMKELMERAQNADKVLKFIKLQKFMRSYKYIE